MVSDLPDDSEGILWRNYQDVAAIIPRDSPRLSSVSCDRSELFSPEHSVTPLPSLIVENEIQIKNTAQEMDHIETLRKVAQRLKDFEELRDEHILRERMKEIIAVAVADDYNKAFDDDFEAFTVSDHGICTKAGKLSTVVDERVRSSEGRRLSSDSIEQVEIPSREPTEAAQSVLQERNDANEDNALFEVPQLVDREIPVGLYLERNDAFVETRKRRHLSVDDSVSIMRLSGASIMSQDEQRLKEKIKEIVSVAVADDYNKAFDDDVDVLTIFSDHGTCAEEGKLSIALEERVRSSEGRRLSKDSIDQAEIPLTEPNEVGEPILLAGRNVNENNDIFNAPQLSDHEIDAIREEAGPSTEINQSKKKRRKSIGEAKSSKRFKSPDMFMVLRACSCKPHICKPYEP